MMVDAWIWDYVRRTRPRANGHSGQAAGPALGDFKAGARHLERGPRPGRRAASSTSTPRTAMAALQRGNLGRRRWTPRRRPSPCSAGGAPTRSTTRPTTRRRSSRATWLHLRLGVDDGRLQVRGDLHGEPRPGRHDGRAPLRRCRTSANDWVEGIRDLTLHPNFRIAHFDALAFFQAHGVSLCMPSSLGPGRGATATAWSDYHAITQRPGHGRRVRRQGEQPALPGEARPGELQGRRP